MIKIVYLLILYAFLLGGCAQKPEGKPENRPIQYIEERYWMGRAQGKYLLTIARYEVRGTSDYRIKSTLQIPCDSYDAMIEEIKKRKDIN